MKLTARKDEALILLGSTPCISAYYIFLYKEEGPVLTYIRRGTMREGSGFVQLYKSGVGAPA
jgi:hypothetical protein